MDFRLLGRLGVEADGRDVAPSRPRERAVLGLLLLRHPSAVGVEELLDAVWGETPPPTARTALQGVVSALRRHLGAERIKTQPSAYRLQLLPEDRYDAARFEALVADAAGATAAVRAELLREALDLFRGEPFADLDLEIDLHAEAARLDGLRLSAEEARIEAELELGRHREVLPRLQRLVAEQPLREGLRGQLILALYRSGRQADALRVAQDARTILSTELGVEPGPALQRLERQVLEQDPALLGAGASVAPPVETAPLGGPATFLAVRPAPVGDGPAGEAGEGRPDGVPSALLADIPTAHGAVEAPARRGTVFAFTRARDAAAAAAAIQRAARRAASPLKIGLHSGTAAAEQATRLADLAHPGQIVLSRPTRDLLREAPLHEVDVRELGQHRLTDLGPSQPLFQLVAPGLAVDFPATRGLDALPTNLPVQPTPLIGREAELEAIIALVRDPAVRLVTLTGTGGTGKTRLGLHAAAELLQDAPDGTWFVPLDALRDPGLVPSTVASILGVAADGPSALGAVARELEGRRTLLILDNFEHLLAASAFVAKLLEAAPGVTVLVTSRVPLKLDGERVIEVPPLPVPSADPAVASDADLTALLAVGSVALFAARAAAVRPEFALTTEGASAVVRLCRALDGLPLAIELAASRLGLMSPAAILERLDRPLRLVGTRGLPGGERHLAIDAAIDWSHDLLGPAARQLFAELAVFAGGWTLDAAEAVCSEGLDVVGGLAGLVDHSLVRIGGAEADPRFGMLETIREHAAAKLDASGAREDLEERHARFYVSLAESAEPELRGNPGPWLARLETDHDNFRAALDRRAGIDGGLDVGARLAGALWRFWYLAGHLSEGRTRLEHAAAAHPEQDATRVKVLIGAAVMAVNTLDPATAAGRAGEALELARGLGDAASTAYAQFMLANAAMNLGDGTGARRGFEESLTAFREQGDEHSALLAARGLALALLDAGELDAARDLYQDILRRARAAGNGRLEASSLGALATIAFDEGRITDATLLLRESLRLHRELGDRLDTAIDLARAARTLAIGGHPNEAAQLLGVLGAIRDELGSRGRSVQTLADVVRASLQRQLPPAELDRRIQEGARLRLDAALELALETLG